ncbi:hypothetical protein [Streptomyces mirabilis]|jgi:hypothetical protein|uniref:Secreted protein n=1 Tax=Streptomyces mirabilis TaxID=68239 RepID=A0A1I2Q3C8_9ACTN|nr:hypothetical protein [Streptomyces mirabilis]SFG21869.1 hypothetical protein SAMN02787118_117108 [Streptomyces mirabilis]
MTRRSHFQRLLLLAASTTVIAGGAVLPSSAMAATATPHTATVTTVAADHDAHRQHGSPASAQQWVETTDAVSGIKFRLPGKPEVMQFTQAVDGMNGRLYKVRTDNGVIVFAVFDLPCAQGELDDALRGLVDGYNAGTQSPKHKLSSTGVHKVTVHGQPGLDARLSAPDGAAGSARLIAGDTHFTEMISLSPKGKEKPMQETYQQLLASVHNPHAHAPRAD